MVSTRRQPLYEAVSDEARLHENLNRDIPFGEFLVWKIDGYGRDRTPAMRDTKYRWARSSSVSSG